MDDDLKYFSALVLGVSVVLSGLGYHFLYGVGSRSEFEEIKPVPVIYQQKVPVKNLDEPEQDERLKSDLEESLNK